MIKAFFIRINKILKKTHRILLSLLCKVNIINRTIKNKNDSIFDHQNYVFDHKIRASDYRGRPVTFRINCPSRIVVILVLAVALYLRHNTEWIVFCDKLGVFDAYFMCISSFDTIELLSDKP